MTNRIRGVVPVMLTPFTNDDKVDFVGLEKLVEWYLEHGAGSLFAVCQSSEMQFLSLDERREISSFVVRQTRGRVPVVSAGHISESILDQIAELSTLAGTGVEALILVTNRIDPSNSGFEVFKENLQKLLAGIPSETPLGLYECPAPYRRLLSDDEIKLCRDTGRFVVLKDVSCNLEVVKRRIVLTEGTDFVIINANAAIAHDAMKAGSAGFAGVFTNIHPDLYAWLYLNKDLSDPLVQELRTFLALSANAESLGYPVLAKRYHQRLGTFASIASRSVTYDVHEKHWALEAVLDHIQAGTDAFRQHIGDHSKRSAV